MGSEASAYKAAFIARYGEHKWRERSAEFDAIWRSIADGIDALELDFNAVKLFQDSLPICGQERALVHDLAAQGSRNHQLLESLMRRGAKLIGTESPTLLLDEYKLLQSPERTETQAAVLLEARDRSIARQVDASLGDSETGLLFMGALHKVAHFLPARIKVEYLAVHG
jgi:hypothetical protein